MAITQQPDSSRSGLIVIDMLNAYDHEDADTLAANVEPIVPRIADVIKRAVSADVPVVYVNDNYGDWKSSVEGLVESALDGRHPELVQPILPPGDAMFVLKARHSIFYSTPLEYLLGQEGVGRLVLTGQVTEQCILYSALDAYVRHFDVVVPRDCTAPIDRELGDAALAMMERNMRAKITTAAACDFAVAGSKQP